MPLSKPTFLLSLLTVTATIVSAVHDSDNSLQDPVNNIVGGSAGPQKTGEIDNFPQA